MKTSQQYLDEMAKKRDVMIREGRYSPRSAADLLSEMLVTAMKDVEEDTIKRCAAALGTSETIGREVR